MARWFRSGNSGTGDFIQPSGPHRSANVIVSFGADGSTAAEGRLNGGVQNDFMSAVKEQARELVARLPEDATRSDLVYEIDLRRKVEAGLRDLDEGRSTPHEEVRKRFLDR